MLTFSMQIIGQGLRIHISTVISLCPDYIKTQGTISIDHRDTWNVFSVGLKKQKHSDNFKIQKAFWV